MIETTLIASAAASAGAWLYLLGLRGGFWRARPRVEDEGLPAAAPAPRVVAVIPARNEADAIGPCLRSLFAQDYPGEFRVILVDDGSEDGTAQVARRTAAAMKAESRLEIVRGAPLPGGWTGKLWAVAQGVGRAASATPDFLWLTDADIAHDFSELRRLVAIAQAQSRDLVSLMVRLRCESLWESMLIPAFVFFFQMLYPFRWANDAKRSTAAAAGGSMLVRREALERAGGIEAIKGEVIDDCALAALIKKRGGIWIGLTAKTHSLRRYDTLSEIWSMVARSAYTQLRHSPLLLAGTVIAMAIVFMAPVPVFAAAALLPWSGRLDPDVARIVAMCISGSALAMMAAAYNATLVLYGRDRRYAFLLPVVALLYCAMTVDSAWRHWRGRGGGWKGRTYGRGSAAMDRIG